MSVAEARYQEKIDNLNYQVSIGHVDEELSIKLRRRYKDRYKADVARDRVDQAAEMSSQAPVPTNTLREVRVPHLQPGQYYWALRRDGLGKPKPVLCEDRGGFAMICDRWAVQGNDKVSEDWVFYHCPTPEFPELAR